jgi:peroxiredoxin
VPGYLEEAKNLKALGIDEVIIYCVNDGAVMDAWAEDQGVDQKGGFITMMGDPSGSVTRALGMSLNHPGPMSKLGYERCKRFALYIEDGTIKLAKVAEQGPAGEEDPAGDDFPEVTLAPAMIEAITALKKKDEL